MTKRTRKKRKLNGRDTALSQRLRHVMEDGNMTVRLLAWFFDRPYQTVYTWVFRNREPYRFYAAEVMSRLTLLEKLVNRKVKRRELFVPRELMAREREAYVKRLYVEARRVSDSGVSKRAAAE